MLTFSGPATLRYDTPENVILKPGDHVLCAVTGARIPLDRLLYWSVDYQEAYADATAAARAREAGGAERLAAARG